MSNENALKVRAKLLGITPARLATLQGLGLTPEEATPFARFTDDQLAELLDYGLPGEELVRRYEELGTSYQLHDYALIRKQLSEAEIDASGVSFLSLHEGFKRDLTLEEIVWINKRFSAYTYQRAKMAGIGREELEVASKISKRGLSIVDQYVDGRRQGYPADELLEAARKLEGVFDGFKTYLKCRDDGETAEHLLYVVRGNPKWLETYVKFREALPELEFDKLRRLLLNGVQNPQEYREAVLTATHDEIIDVLRTGMTLAKYLEIRKGQVRVKLHEIVELGIIRQEFEHFGIVTYIGFLDSGLRFGQVRDLLGKDMSAYDIEFMRGPRYGMDYEQLMEVKRSPLSAQAYRELRNAGLDHDTIIAEAEATLFPSENVDADLQD